MSRDLKSSMDYFYDPATSDFQKLTLACLAIYGFYTVSKQVVSAVVPEATLLNIRSKIPIINNFSFSLPSAQQLVRMIPGAQEKFKQEVAEQVQDMIKPIVPLEKQLTSIPLKPVSPAALLEHCKDLQAHDVKPDGSAFAYVYDTNDEELSAVVDQIQHMFSNTNALSPLAFPSLRYMENCITSMCGELLHLTQDEGSAGVLTSGGTESIICALKAYRDRATDLLGITKPEIIAPITVHPAFTKGCHLLGIQIHLIPLHQNPSHGVDMGQYAAAINSNTILLVGSAPAYPHGLIDPIATICALSTQHNQIPVHVDACIGGFFLPFVEMIQDEHEKEVNPLPLWDFRLPQVTSISLDLHKYGYTPKGASCIMYRNTDFRKYQYYAQANWPGGLFVSPSLLGTRGGGSIAAAWATLQLYGVEGYKKITRETLQAKDVFTRAVKIHPEFEIIGSPLSSIISFRVKPEYTNELNILSIGDALEMPKLNTSDGVYELSVKWKIERQQGPNSIHMTLMAKHIHTCDKFSKDLTAAKRYVRENLDAMKGKGSTGMYGLVVNVSKVSTTLIDEFLVEFESQVMTPDRPQVESKKALAAAERSRVARAHLEASRAKTE